MKIEVLTIAQAENMPDIPAPEIVPQEYGKITTCAKRVGVSERTLWAWVSRGLPHIKVDAVTLIKFADLDAWLARHRVERDKVRDIVDSIVRKHRNG